MRKNILRIIGNFILLIFGLKYICHLKANWNDLFGGTIESIQGMGLIIIFLILIIFLLLEIACLLIYQDFSSIIEDFIRGASDNGVARVYFSSIIHILIGYVSVILIVFSILYGAYMTSSTSEGERIKLVFQIKIWSGYSLYFVAVIFALFIYPLMKRLDSLK